MGIVRLRADDLIDLDTEAQYVFIHSMKATAGIHRHDYYEIFLVVRGEVDHVANGQLQRLTEGSLVFIRPDDSHYYVREPDRGGQVINLAFPCHVADALFLFLGEGLRHDRLLKGVVPPTVHLSKAECNLAMTMLEEFDMLQRTQNAGVVRMKLRALLAEIFSKYFHLESHERKNSMPGWLMLLCREMQIKENMAEGIPAMVRLTGMTHEHLCRQFKAHLHMTPGEFVNSLRLNYASNLLQVTGDKILCIAMEVGFDSLSHFYHVFKKHFGVSPADYRRRREYTWTCR